MIFLTVGTWYRGYDRLVKAVDDLVADGTIDDEVIAQIGYGSYRPKQMQVITFCSPDEFVAIISRSRLVISHAGIGSVLYAIKLGKPTIVVPRRADLGEAFDNHQFTTSKYLVAEGKILAAYETSDLPAELEKAKTFVPTKNQMTEGIVRTVQEFIDRLVSKSRS